MTPEQKLQAVVEKAGECWHTKFQHSDGGHKCGDCQKWLGHIEIDNDVPYAKHFNPSPTDLNELFRLAEKLKLHVEADVDTIGCSQVSIHRKRLGRSPCGQSLSGRSVAEALLNALYESIKEAS